MRPPDRESQETGHAELIGFGCALTTAAIRTRPGALCPRAGQDHVAIGMRRAGFPVTWPSVSGRVRRLYGFELEPEVRDWLDSLSDSDFKRVDEVCGMLAEKGTELGGPWSGVPAGLALISAAGRSWPGFRTTCLPAGTLPRRGS